VPLPEAPPARGGRAARSAVAAEAAAAAPMPPPWAGLDDEAAACPDPAHDHAAAPGATLRELRVEAGGGGGAPPQPAVAARCVRALLPLRTWLQGESIGGLGAP
jgi:hypothetical protein